MRLIDPNFRPHVGQYILQCLLATVTVMALLALMDAVEHTAMVACLGASAFIAFTMPHARVSTRRHLLGGYIVGIGIGAAFGLLHRWLDFPEGSATEHAIHIALGGLAVGGAIFLMVVTNTEHPPAAGVALGLVVSETWTAVTLAGILVVILGLTFLKRALRRFLIDLI